MTINDAILHCESKGNADCSGCANEHKQLAEWLKELKCRRERDKEDLEYMLQIQNLLISENGWVIDTGNYQQVNDELLCKLKENIKRHPFLWKWFFMVA